MSAKALTPEEKANIAQQMYIGAVPYVDRAYQRDPRTLIGNSALAAARSTDPVANGKWGIVEGLSRIGQGFLGHEINKRQEEKYRNLDVQEAQRLQRAGMDPLRAALGLKQDEAGGTVATPGAVPQVPSPNGVAPAPGINDPMGSVASALGPQQPGQVASMAPQIAIPPGTQPPGMPPDPSMAPTGAATGRSLQRPATPPPVGAARRSQGIAPPPRQGAQGQNFMSYRSSAYDALEDKYAAQYGIPVSLLRSIRLNGERSNANQTSSAGAKSVYQFTPETRQRFINTHGIDPWASPEDAVHAAAIHLAGDWKRSGGDARETAASYIAGPSGKNRGRVTRAYVDRVVGGMADLGGDTVAEGQAAPIEGDVTVPELETVSEEKPTAPSLGERVRSSRLQVAYNLLNDPQGQGENAALAYAAAAPYLEQGWTDEQKIKDDRQQDEAYLASIGYQGDVNRYNQNVEDVRKQRIDERQAAIAQKYGRQNVEQEYGLRMEQDRRNNIADIQQAQAEAIAKAGGTGAQLAEDYGVPLDAQGNARTDGLWGVISSGGPINKRPVQGPAETRLEALARQSERLDALRNGFDDAYFGAGAKWVGDAWNKVDEATGLGNQKRVEWWKMYNAMDAKEIHDLYGAALTGGEEARWNATVINTGTSPETARRNLDERMKILNTALARNARAAAKVYNQEQIWELIGGETGAKRIDDYQPLYKAPTGQKGSAPAAKAPVQPSRFKTTSGSEAYYDAKTGKWMIPDNAPVPSRQTRPQGTTRVDWSKARRNTNNYVERR